MKMHNLRKKVAAIWLEVGEKATYRTVIEKYIEKYPGYSVPSIPSVCQAKKCAFYGQKITRGRPTTLTNETPTLYNVGDIVSVTEPKYTGSLHKQPFIGKVVKIDHWGADVSNAKGIVFAVMLDEIERKL